MEEGSNGLGEVHGVTASVIIDSDRMWNAYVGTNKVPNTCDVLARFRSFPLTDDKLSDMIKAINNAGLCPYYIIDGPNWGFSPFRISIGIQ